jgi:hypothetical protein
MSQWERNPSQGFSPTPSLPTCAKPGQTAAIPSSFWVREHGTVKQKEPTVMTIEVHKPELEALIQEQLRSGVFTGVEDMLIQALKSAPLSERPGAPNTKKNLAQFLMESPLSGSGLNLERQKDYPRQVDL